MFSHFERAVFTTFLALSVAACGGGSSSDQVLPSGSSQGGLTLLIGDAPADDFDAIVLTVENILLIGDDGQLDLELTEAVEVDLLQLRNATELLVDAELPVGSYSKIRLEISDLQLQVFDVNGEIESTQRPPLPANGKVDLNPQGDFEIRAGDNLVVEIDFDLDRSLKVTETGNGTYRFRPVVFVDVIESEDSQRLVRLDGVMGNLATDDRQLDLCKPEDLDDCVLVRLNDDALAVDANGAELGLAGLIDGDQATLFGYFGTEGDFAAAVLAVGAPDNVRQREGVVAGAIEEDILTIDYEDERFFVTVLPGTLLLGDDDETLAIADLGQGSEVEAWIIEPPAANSAVALVIQAEDSEDAVEAELEGQFVGLEDGVITLLDDGIEKCLRAGSETQFVIVDESVDAADSDPISLNEFAAELESGSYDGRTLTLEAEGMELVDCFEAELIIVEID